MKKRLNVVVSIILSIALLCSGMVTPLAYAVQGEGESATYEIYPTPHAITYTDENIALPEELPVVYGELVDQYTKTRASEAFSEAGITLIDDAPSALALRVGVYGSSDAADQYFKENNLVESTLFEKTDAYQLVVNTDGVSVLGKNTDAAFYGLTTLKRILQQVSARTVHSLTVKDYSDVALRGFIEGYYGNPWSNEDRAELMKFGGELKMNIYFYAPKDDPKHNAQWRELYTEEELEKIRMLAQAGEESKCRYGYALHTFMNNPVRFNTEENYQTDLAIAKAKFTQVLDAGVRQLAVLADDVYTNPPSADKSVKFMTDLTNWLIALEKEGKYPGLKTSIPFCPGDYMGDGGNPKNRELKELSKSPEQGGLPNSVPIIMTGGKVWGHVTNDFLNTFYGHTGRSPFMWVNWPCSDNGKQFLVMGGFDTVLRPSVDPGKIQGIMLNPMQQSEPSKVAIFGNADYAWNIWSDKAAADKAWYDSFKYVDHVSHQETNTSTALRELSKHMIYENGDNPFPESVELKPTLDAFKNKLNSGASVAGDVDTLKTEFQTLSDAADLYLERGHTRLADQIQYWLHSWQDITAANLLLLDALKEAETGDGGNASNNHILSLYTNAQARYEKSKTYGFHYVDHTEYAMVGSQVIQPFTQFLLSKVAETAQQIMDPTIFIQTPITSRSDTPQGGLNAMVDGNPKTEAVFKTPDSIAKDEYVGLRFNRAISLNAVRFLMGRDGNLGDTFTACKLQYTPDGADWIDIPDAAFTGTPAVLEKTGLNLTARGVRAIATQTKAKTWLGVREIYINDLLGPEEPEVPEENNRLTGTAFVTDDVSIQGGSLAAIIDDSMSTYIHLAENPYKEDNAHWDKVPPDGAIGLNFGKSEQIGHISITQDSGNDKMTNAVLEYSMDGTSYTKIADVTGNVNMDVNITAQYVRLRTQDYTAGWVKIFDFTVEKPSNKPQKSLIRTERWTVAGGAESNLLDGDDNTMVWYNPNPSEGSDKDTSLDGDFIGLDLGEEMEVGEVRFVVGAGDADKWTHYDLAYSTDNSTWTKVKSLVSNGTKDIVEVNLAGARARYVRLVNTKRINKWVKFSEISVEPYDPDATAKEILYKSSDAQVNYPAGRLTDDTATLSAVSVTLEPGGYVGIKLPRTQEIVEMTANYDLEDGLTLETGANELEMQPVSLPLNASVNARYIRLRNTGSTSVTFSLNSLVVKYDVSSAPVFLESNIGGAENDEDARKKSTTGNVFDGDVTTSCKFCASQANGQYVTYDLGRTRSVSSLDLIVGSGELDYVRNGKVQISMDNQSWTDVITITSDVNAAGGDVTAGQAGGWAASGEPNFLKQSGTIEPQDARYVRVVFTDNFSYRWLVINEIVVNGGEYIPEKNPLFVADPPEGNASAVPSKLIDGDITTGFTPNMTGHTSGSLIYRLSEMTNVGQINILQSSGVISNARVEVRTGADEWTEIGTLSQAFNSLYIPADKQNVFEIKLSWENVTPTFYELLTIEKGVIPLDGERLQSLVNRSDDVPLEDESKYDAAVLEEYRTAKTAAQKVLEQLNTEANTLTQKEINDAYDRLTAAAEALAENGDPEKAKAVLRGLIDDMAAEEQKYTPNSWQAYLASEAYRQAQTALDGNDVAAIHAARTALTEEIQNLVLRADRTKLDQLLAQVDALQQSDYTAESFAVLQTEVTRIRVAMEDENLVQADADKLLDALVAAKEKLVKKTSGGHSSSSSNTTTTTITKPDGTKETTTVNKATGTTTVTLVTTEGVKSQTVTDKSGKTETTVTVPLSAVQKGDEIALPVPPVDPVKTTPIMVNLPSSDRETTVSIPLTNKTDGAIAVLVGTDGTEKILMGAFVENGAMLVSLSGSAMLKIKDNRKNFTDVPADRWSHGAVQFVASRELFQGTGVNTFAPRSPMTRAMFATVLHRLAGAPDAGKSVFEDVQPGQYYANAVAWASGEGIVKGTGAKFDPDSAITREQLAAMLFRYAGKKAGTHTKGAAVASFIDGGSVSPWAEDAVAWAVENGILNGSNDHRLHPGDKATREEVAVILSRFIMTKSK